MPYFVQKVSGDSQEVNVLRWKPQWTAENLDREKWSEIMQKEKSGKKRRLPDNKKLRKKKMSVIVKHLR